MLIPLLVGLFLIAATVIIVMIMVFKNRSNVKKGITYYSEKKYDKALEALEKAVEEDPTLADAKWYIANIHEFNKNYDEAKRVYYELINGGKYGEAFQLQNCYSNLIRVLLNKNELAEAEQAVEALIELNPSHAAGYSKLGDLAMKKYDYDKAVSAFRKSLSINPANVSALKSLGLCYNEMKNRDNCIKTLKKYLEASGKKDFEVLRIIGINLRELGDNEASISYFEKLKQSKKYGSKASIELAVSYLRYGNKNDAAQELKEAIQQPKINLDDKTWALYQLADIHVKNGKLNDAYKLWEQVYNINPDYEDVSSKLASFGSIKDSEELGTLLSLPKNKLQEVVEKIITELGHRIEKQISSDEKSFVYLTRAKGKGESYEAIVQFVKSNQPLGEFDVRELVKIVQEYRAYKGHFVATSKFSEAAQKKSEAYPVDLVDSNDLKKILKKLNL